MGAAGFAEIVGGEVVLGVGVRWGGGERMTGWWMGLRVLGGLGEGGVG